MCKVLNYKSKNGSSLGRVRYPAKEKEWQDSPGELRSNDLVAQGDQTNWAHRAFKGLSSQTSKMGFGLPAGLIRDEWVISWDEIQNIEFFGSGTFGKIYRATYDYMEVAVKVMSVPWDQLSDKQRQEFMLEIHTAIRYSRHKNVLRVYGYTLEPVVSIVTEFCEHGSVADCIDKGYNLSILQKLDICIDAARGILSLHRKHVLHRDIACRNILLDRHMTARIADFGMCRVINPIVSSQEAVHHTCTEAGPLKWMSPESLMMQNFSKRSDVWSFAVTIWEIFVEEEPYGADPPYLAAAAVIHKGIRPNLSKLPESIRKDITILLQACWRELPEDRLSMKEVLVQLSGIKDKYVALQQEMSLVPTVKSKSTTPSTPPSVVYAWATKKCIAEKKDSSNNHHHATSIGERFRRYLCRIRSARNDSAPNKLLEINPSPYLFHRCMKNSNDNLQYSTQRTQRINLIANSKPTQSNLPRLNKSKTEKFTQRNNSKFQSRRTSRDTLSRPQYPRQEKQDSAIIPSKNHLLISPAHGLDSATQYCAPTRPLAIQAEMRSTYRNIDSHSTTDATMETDSENESPPTVEINEKVVRISSSSLKMAIGDKSLSSRSSDVNSDYEYNGKSTSSNSLLMLGKNGGIDGIYNHTTKPADHTRIQYSSSNGSDEEIYFPGICGLNNITELPLKNLKLIE